MCGYICIGFIDFLLKGNSLLDYTQFFSTKEYEKNDKIMLKIFSIAKKNKTQKIYCVICGNLFVEGLETL